MDVNQPAPPANNGAGQNSPTPASPQSDEGGFSEAENGPTDVIESAPPGTDDDGDGDGEGGGGGVAGAAATAAALIEEATIAQIEANATTTVANIESEGATRRSSSESTTAINSQKNTGAPLDAASQRS